MTANQQQRIKAMLRRYSRAAVRAARGGRYPREELVEELRALREQVVTAAGLHEAEEWLAPQLATVTQEVEAALSEASPDWRLSPPAWVAELLLSREILRPLMAASAQALTVEGIESNDTL